MRGRLSLAPPAEFFYNAGMSAQRVSRRSAGSFRGSSVLVEPPTRFLDSDRSIDKLYGTIRPMDVSISFRSNPAAEYTPVVFRDGGAAPARAGSGVTRPLALLRIETGRLVEIDLGLKARASR